MVLFVFGIIVLLIALGLVIAGRVGDRGDEINLRPWGIGAIVIAILMLIGSTFNTVGARQVGIPITLGKVGGNLQSGVHLLAPWTSVINCPLSEETSIQNGDPKSGDALYNQAVPISGSDQGGALADVTVLYHINPQDAVAVYQKYKCNTTSIKANLIAQNVRSITGQAATGFISVDLKSHRSDIEKITLNRLQTTLAPYGITVDQVIIADLTLADNVQIAANNKLAAEQNAQTALYHKQQAEVDAQTAIIQAQGIANANKAKQTSLTPQALCYDYIQALSNTNIAVMNGNNPCSTGASASTPTSVIVSPKA